jgi:SAM-dependent methyltransferase
MRTKLSKQNPFFNLRLEHGYAWEMTNKIIQNNKEFNILDYGGYDGSLIEKFIKSGIVTRGTTVDLNADSVNLNFNKTSEGHKLLVIEKGKPLPFEDKSYNLITIIGVIEHVYNQDFLLSELHRVLISGGNIIIAVPGKHLFSFLDFGNWKFLFPKIHKWYIERKCGKDYYDYHFVECANGLIGDIEVEKGWHEHFTFEGLENLLTNNGFEVFNKDGFGFFYRIFHNIGWILPFTSKFMNTLIKIDSKYFSQAEIFITARKV